MLRTTLCSGTALALVLSTSGACAAGLKVTNPASNSGSVVQKVHTVYEAEALKGAAITTYASKERASPTASMPASGACVTTFTSTTMEISCKWTP